MGWGRRPAKTVGTRQDGEMSKGAEVDSSMSERPQHQRPRRLADWLNPTGRRRVPLFDSSIGPHHAKTSS